jgi:iron(III) transport system permease protein
VVSAVDLLTARTRTAAGKARGLAAVVVVIAVCFAAPFGYLVVRSVGEDGAAATLVSTTALAPLGRSIALASAVAVATAVLGLACGWLVARTDLPGARAWAVLLALPLVIPSYIGAFTLQAAFATGGLVSVVLSPLTPVSLPRVEGFAAAFGVLVLLTFPYVLLPVMARLRQVPASLEESARLLGRGPWSVFWTVVVPQARGAVLAGALLVFLYVISDFGAVQLLRYDTLTRVIYTNVLDRSTSLPLSLQLGLLALAVVVAERVATGGQRPAARQVTRGTAGLRVRLGRWRAAALAFVAAVVGFALVAPVSVLSYWAARGLVGGGVHSSAVSADPAVLLGPLRNTALAGASAAVVAVAAVLPVAYLTVRHSGRVADAANAFVVAGFALPGLVIALSLTALTLAAPGPIGAAYQTLPLLVFAYVVHFGAQTLRTAQVGVAAIPPAVGDAARLLGAGRLRRLVAVELPLLYPPMLAGGGLVLLSTMKELPATLLLAPAGFETLATRTWGATQDAYWADASITALLLLLLSAVLTWAFVLRRSAALS